MDKIIQFILRFAMMNNTLLVILLFFIISICCASKCTQTRKSHSTSCNIYYDCINLPDGGYVWVPSKCSDGLVFQEYLGLCVLPGDTWNCDDTITSNKLSTEKQYYDDSSDKNKLNSSMYLTENNNIGNLFSLLPYPLIEIKQISNNQDDKSNIIINSQQKIKSSANRLFFFINFGTYLNNKQNLLSSSVVENPSKEIFIKMIKNYMMNHRKTENEMIKKKLISETTDENHQDEMTSNFATSTQSSQLMIAETNHIVAIIGNLGEKQYVTIEQYKELSNNYNIEIIDVIPCVSEGTRLPNLTDCVRYYTCDPNTATIHEFRCPPQTAFNKRTNFCDTKKYKSCIKNRNDKSATIESSSSSSSSTTTTTTTTTSFSITEKLFSLNNNKDKEKNYYCESTGKFPDLSSDKFYYFCYLSKKLGTVESMRMSCPNELIFCQNRKVCTTKKLCISFD